MRHFRLPWTIRIRRAACACALVLAAVAFADATRLLAEDAVRFNRDIRPILSENCFACHGPSSAGRKADLRLDLREGALEAGAIAPNEPENSELVRRIFSTDEFEMMPPPESKKTLTTEQKELLRRWIAQGAEYEPHWSFIPVPDEVPVPSLDDSWIRNEIDAFVLRRLNDAGLEPAAEAARERWLRRVTFDLTGLPPTIAELDAFLADASPLACEKVVDRLLTSPAYGERMANAWLDVARYADTFGYQNDRDMHVWPWRDWVIRAFNDNLPYDKFILWQIAGDMLPNPTRDQILATTFNRLHRQTNEGGSIEEEFRIEYVADRVRTMGSAFLGLTLECCRCHDHKYDPISQKDYYQLTAFFNNIDESGLYSHFTETAPTPTLLLYDGDQQARHEELLNKIRLKEQELAEAAEQAQRRALSRTLVRESLPEPSARFNFDDLKPAGDYHPVPGKEGQAIEFGGDDEFTCGDAGAFGRTDPFSFALWVRPTEHAPRMVVLHRSRAAEDSAFRGYSLVLDDGYPTFSLVHFWPGNAIQLRAKQPIPTGTWTHLAITYDGSSRAAGVHLYVDGAEIECDVVRDKLTRDIIHRQEWGDYDVGSVKLSLGARFRDVGFRNGAVDDLFVYESELSPLEIALIGGQELPDGAEPQLKHHLLRHNQAYQKLSAELRELRREENELVGQVRQIMVMKELPYRRETFLLARGDYTARTEPVFPDTPERIFPMPQEFPRNRLGFARWLVDERNPLTARVAVNRFWQLFFGRGLVGSSEDFGSQGQLPTHPELLDWLARQFMDEHWDVHALCRRIVLSSTYRQSSVPNNLKTYDVDPENRLLARGPRHRLAAEQVRDNVLAASGLLVRTIGGPSVYPYQPPGLWEESGTGKSYQQSTGAGLYRRSLYTFWRRTSPPPSMTTFDAPSREYCVARRERTATPLQSLVLLNGPQFVEAARVLAEKLIRKHAGEVDARIVEAFRRLTSRAPSEREMALLRTIYASQREHFTQHSEQARHYISAGESPHDDDLNPADHAATTALVQAIMNFDECVTKR